VNKLYFGDNLDVLKEHVADESVDLVYLDPPFNSNATYNVLFEDPRDQASDAQAEAFRDTWGWGEPAANAYEDVMAANGDVALVLRGLRQWLGENAMMAYLAMMAARLIELRRVLRPTGSLYLHCDPTASHYLKVILDAVFGHENWLNEIVWKRTGAHGSARRWAPVHDVLLFYGASGRHNWNRVFQAYEPTYLATKYRHRDDRGPFQDVSATGAGVRTGASGRPWRMLDPTKKGRHWAIPHAVGVEIDGFARMTPQEKLDALEACGDLYWPQSRDGTSNFPRIKQRPSEGNPIQDCILDIAALNSQARERLGYPTQKPIALLERIIAASTNPGDMVLDPFCGCGTTVEAAEKLGRTWTGIDVTHYAVTLIEKRIREKYPNAAYTVHGRPVDLAGARDLARRDKHQFQWWAAWRLGCQTYREAKRGPDRGIDGNIYFANGPFGTGRIIISVKGGENVGIQMVRELRAVVEREKAEMGVLVMLAEPSKPMMGEASAAGYVQKSAHGRLPRLQIATIDGLLSGAPPKLPPLPQPQQILRPARRAASRDQLELLLPIGGAAIASQEGVFVDPRFLRFEPAARRRAG
jgi:site-specific DNA-methyltransferase (adenine-specific)